MTTNNLNEVERLRMRVPLQPNTWSSQPSGTAGKTLGAVSLGISAIAFIVGTTLFLLGALLILAAGIGLFIWWAGLWVLVLLFGLAFLVGLVGVILSVPRQQRGGLSLAMSGMVVDAAALAASLIGAVILGRGIFG